MREDGRVSTPPTLEDVARVAGVSRATVSRVINQKRQVAPDLKAVVEKAIVETGYVPNRAARSLVTGRTGTVAVVISGVDPEIEGNQMTGQVFADPFFGRIVAAFVRALRPHDLHPVLMLAETDDARAQVMTYLRQGNADGALLVAAQADDPLPGMLVEAGQRAVLFARPEPALPISFVDVANRDGARLAAKHLIERGCDELAVISGPSGLYAAEERLAGFRDEVSRHGRAYVPEVSGEFTLEGGEAAMERLLDTVPGLDGVFAANDYMAQGAVHAIQARGLRVPEDVAVVGFDDSSIAPLCRPALTSVRQPVEEMAAEMARLLIGQIAEGDRQVRSVVFDPTLVVRDSA
ncbi:MULTISPECIES: LacI family DNA-binding transcriptional regulator [Oerskovia]|jgi:DNA-binding LacI/PurR family transcriptional regulator|uniref:Ribose operon repressor n=2 Tax=Oerskovia TaxID=162491 RepID=A0A161YFF4_9CELL|nr:MULTISPECIES: LacI family DNA-binding transcriptional regulator [Oerskovia]KZM34638.1 ribose operon repressor [Oerskovia enterophila]MBD7982829.1 LacI family DNA-binding transcriptional regulator [Oerskovia merdavium]OCI32943.1 ribose operon repressor [Oerskovia enterophila]